MKVLLITTIALAMGLVACESSRKKQFMAQQAAQKKALEKAKEEPPKVRKKAPVKLWSYSGITGPGMWGDIDDKYIACKDGKEQSPVDLRYVKPKSKRSVITNFKNSPFAIIDNGHTVTFSFPAGNRSTIDGKDFDLLQIHFHSMSEHTLSGQPFPLEAHFVHKGPTGLAVIGVMFKEGAKNPALEVLWSQIPKRKHEIMDSTVDINPQSLIPSRMTHYAYMGSLTTPPCSEGVSWTVLNTPLEASKEQLDQFRALYSNNNRPVQPPNDRKIRNYY